ncbi:hypothetical protein [Streptacidiphilus anmyonensis]|uniref:LexA family protein n=1 Tax=Streptacidiphilus anmyonensis TaxID=405782 RepID=UPI0034E2D99B
MEEHPSPGRPAGTARSARGLTPRQEAVLDAIGAWSTEHGDPPSLREIGAVVGLASTSRSPTRSTPSNEPATCARTPTGPAATH